MGTPRVMWIIRWKNQVQYEKINLPYMIGQRIGVHGTEEWTRRSGDSYHEKNANPDFGESDTLLRFSYILVRLLSWFLCFFIFRVVINLFGLNWRCSYWVLIWIGGTEGGWYVLTRTDTIDDLCFHPGVYIYIYYVETYRSLPRLKVHVALSRFRWWLWLLLMLVK